MKRYYSKFIVSVITIILLMIPLVLFAAADLGLDVAQDIGLGDNDLKEIITSIINIALGFLGIISVGFVLYAGFMWMTAGGNADQVGKAKKILIRAVIGLVIILSSFAIATFVINSITDATGLTDGSTPGSITGNTVGGTDANLIVRNWQPYDDAMGTARNILVRIYFNKAIDESTVSASDFSFISTADNSVVNFQLSVVGSRIDIRPQIVCDIEGVEYCLGDTLNYNVSIDNASIVSLDDKTLVCTTGCSTSFTTSDYMDVVPPEVSLLAPRDNDAFSVAINVSIEAQATDDSGVVAGMTFLADDEDVLPIGTDGAEPWLGLFSTAAYNEGDNIDVRAMAEDLSGNIGYSRKVDIRILPAHCFNQVIDQDETKVDCGGSCGSCLGDSCDENPAVDICEPSDSLCGQGVCNLDCVCALAPIITNISPDNGAVGNYITITGGGFGDIEGSVTFLGTASFGDEIVANIADCAVAWSPTQVIVEVPDEVISGGIKLVNNSGDFDTTLDGRGWQGDFIVNSTIMPGICSVMPEAGTALSNITIVGTQFGESKDRVIVGGIGLTNSDISSWTDRNIVSLVPNLQTGKVSVAVDVAGELSNPIQYEVIRDILTPSISYLEPDSGPVGTYITIHGNNFGFAEEDVLVNFINSETTIPADIDFPAMCGEYSVDNEEIVVKVPEGVSLAEWNLVVIRDLRESLPTSFDITDDILSPGICLLEPNNGPVGTLVDVYGEGFAAAGQFSFWENIFASILNWTSGHVGTQVPVDISTGPVQIITSNGGISNTINFSVGSCDANSCNIGDECCSDGICREVGVCEQAIGADEYLWSFTTGQQLPPFVVEDVWPLCDTACINTMIGVRFSNPVILDSLNDISIDVKQCIDKDCTIFETEIDYTEGSVLVGYYDETNYILNINPDVNLQPESYYRVVLKSGSLGIINTEGGYLESINYASTGEELDSYSWTFSTGIDECTLNGVEVLPSEYIIHSQSERLNVTGYPFSESDSCSLDGQMLDPADYAWMWLSTNTSTATIVSSMNEGVITPVWGNPAQTNIIAYADGVRGSSRIIVEMDIPRIDSISPDNGMINENIKTYVTIHGANFGNEQGSTLVLVGGLEVNIADCDSAWSNTQIVIEMPLSTSTGNTIQIIKTGGSDESRPFTVNNILRPAVCSVDPVYGTNDTRVTLVGYNFGDEQGEGNVFFDQLGVEEIDSWSNTKIKTRVPVGSVTGPVVVNVLGNDSNAVIFSMEPFITSLSPNNGSKNSYTTIHGGNFEEVQGDGYVMIGGQRAYLASCGNSWSNTSIIVQIPEGLSLGNKDVQVITHYGVGSNEVIYKVNEKPINPLLCEINPNFAGPTERVELIGDNFGDAPYLGEKVIVDSKQGAEYDTVNSTSCLTTDGSYVGRCSNMWVDYSFNFPESGFYTAWAETENYSMDLTDQGIYHNVNIYLDDQYIGYFSNPTSTPDHQTGQVGLGWVTAGNHIVRYYWNNDWCGGCGDGVGDSNIRFHNVGINTGSPMSYPLFSRAHVATAEMWTNNRVPTYIEANMESGPVSLITQAVVGQQCVGFHIGNWCPGGIYEDIIEEVESNSVGFVKGCVIGTTSSRDLDFMPVVATNSEAIGTLATDGKYIYGKSWGGYDERDNMISIIGTGYQDTVAGQDYGDLVTAGYSLNMTYHSDGFLYNGITTADKLEKINIETGAMDEIIIPTGLMERSTGNLSTDGYKLITSDGQYFYNLSYGHDGGSYNGFKVRVYDIVNNWSLVREWISGVDSFYTDGIIADGVYVYAIQWAGGHKIRKMNAMTGEFIAEWVSEQGNGGSNGSGNDIISGQYDWVNDRVWLGDLVDHSRSPGPAFIYRYNSCNTELVGVPLNCGDGILQVDEGEQCDAIVKEDGELASDWEVYDPSPQGQYSVIYDEGLRRNVIQLQTDGGTSTGFRLGNTGTSGDSWNFIGDNWGIQWRMKTYGSYRVYISTQTTLGHRYITYPAGHGGPNYVPIDMPAIYTDGNWHYVYRDLQADLETEEPGNEILSINGFLIRGNTRVVDIAVGANLNGQQCSDLGDYNAGIIACDVSTCQLAGNDCALGIGFCGDGDIQWPNENNDYELCDGAASLPAPVAHWAMNEDSWTIGEENNVLDSVGTNHGQVMNGDIQTITDGQNGNAGDFSATGNIAIPMTSELQIQNNLTMSAWVYPLDYNDLDDEDIIILGQGAYYLAIGDDGSLRTYWYGKSSPGYHKSAVDSIPLNQWSHIAAVWDDYSSQVKLFVNGQLIYTTTSAGSGNEAINQVWLGGEYMAPNQQRLYDGMMDEVKIWNVALSAQEVNAEFLGSTQNCTNECTLPSVCGNDVLEYGEDCDDGNLVDGDGCSSVCSVENIESDPEPDGSCGDGEVQWPNLDWRYEQCDDGNTSSGDGCNNICYLENGNNYGNCSSCDEEVLTSQVAWWQLNDKLGIIASNSINNLNDGALVNNPSWVNGRIGDNSLQFNGSDQYVDVLDVNGNLNFSDAFTISAWINADEFYQEYSVATIKYQGDEGDERTFPNAVNGLDDYINISSTYNYGHLNDDEDHYDTVSKIPEEIYDYDIIIWDHNTIDIDVSRLERNKPVYVVVRENRYGNFVGEQLAQYDWPVNGYRDGWTIHTTKIKRSSLANNVFIISSDGTGTHGDIWCTWEHYPKLAGRHLGSLISVLSGQIISKGGSYGLYMDNDQIKGYVNFDGTLVDDNNIISTTILDGWNYVSMIYDGVQLQLYLNGEEANSINYSGNIDSNKSKVLMGQFYLGAIDDVKLYNKARSGEDISTSYLSCTIECVGATSLDCGNGVVNRGETCLTCPVDVGECVDPDVCGDGDIDIGEECELGISSTIQGIGVTNQYSCVEYGEVNQCLAIEGWCGDGIIQLNQGEVCESKLVVVAGGYDWPIKTSGSSNNYRFIKLNGINIHYTPRSWALMTFDENWNELSYNSYDVYHPTGNDADINDLIYDIDSIGENINIVLTTWDEPRTNAYNNETFISLMTGIGATEDILRNLEYRSAYLLVANKTTGKVFEDYSPRFGAPIYYASSKPLDSLGSTKECNTVWRNGVNSACQWYVDTDCNNNILDIDEACDYVDGDPNFGGETCNTQGNFSGGSLSCSDQCEIITDYCVPGEPTANVCINTEISAEFDSLMDYSSFIGNVKFEKVTNECTTGSLIGETCSTDEDCVDGVCDLGVAISTGLENIPPNDSQYSKLYIYPEGGLLDVNSEYRATVTGGINGVQDIEGYTLTDDYIWPFYTGIADCLIERVEITPNSYEFNNSNETVNFTVHGYDVNNNSIVGDYNWTIEGDEQLLDVVGSSSQTVQVSATGIGNGELSLRASVYASEESNGDARAPIDIFMCNIPWYYENTDFNFKTRYCRGNGVNHVYNSGFEIDDNGDNIPDTWTQPELYSNGAVLNGYNWDLHHSRISLKPNTAYTISALAAQSEDVNQTVARIVVQTCDNTGNCGSDSLAAGVSNTGTCIIETNNHSQNIELQFTPVNTSMERNSCWLRTNAFVASARIYLLTNSIDDGPIWFDNIQLELGSEVSVYEESNLLPSLALSLDNSAGDELLNILFLQSEYNISDAIGLRVFTNLDHDSPGVWYMENVSNIGNPSSINVGGYSGLQEGRTTYVNAANYNNGDVYTNMFVLSYTQDANSNTQDIFTQMYNNWTFNSNISSYDSKSRLIRDTKRMEHMIAIAGQLEDYYQVNVSYPELNTGTYLVGTTVSAWDSWNNTLGAQLGSLPVDPINEHSICAEGSDPITCWDTNTLNYGCPSNSYVYRYDYVDPEYYIYSNFEYENVTWKGDADFTVLSSPACDNVTLSEGVLSSTVQRNDINPVN